jgi:ribosome-binding factor A
MQNFRKEKITNLIKELSATFIERESGNSSIITVTRVLLTPDNKKANILITVLPKEKENAALNFIKRNLGEMRIYISEKLKINPVPFLSVSIDTGEIIRQKIDELLLKS